MAARAAVLIAGLALAGCLKAAPPAAAVRASGCSACHARHFVREGACHDCHRGDPGAARAELAHARLLSGRAAEHRLPEAAAVREGRRLVEALACRRCHRIAGEGNALATDLDRVVFSREQPALVRSLVEPVSNMPRFGLDVRQAEAVVAFLLRNGRRDAPEETYRVRFARRADQPAAAFDRACGGCHRFLGASGPQGSGSAGPNLSGLFTPFYPRTARGGTAWTESALAEWIRNPRAVRPQTTMPPVALEDDERLRVAAELGWPSR